MVMTQILSCSESGLLLNITIVCFLGMHTWFPWCNSRSHKDGMMLIRYKKMAGESLKGEKVSLAFVLF